MRTTNGDVTNLVLFGMAAAAFVVLLAVMFWPTGENKTGVVTSDTSTQVERNAPADKPKTDLSTQTPTKPAQ